VKKSLLCPACMAPLRGRQVTLFALVCAAAYMFTQHAGPRPQSVTVPRPLTAEEEAYEELSAALEESLVNATEARLQPRQYKPERHRAKLDPTEWRRNRKKVTELTDITSVKPSGDEPVARTAAEPGGMLRADGAKSGGASTLQWLADQVGSAQASEASAVAIRDQVESAGWLQHARAKAERRQRWMAHGAKALCGKLQKLHGVWPGKTWGTLPVGQRQAWQTLQCDEQILKAAASPAEQAQGAQEVPSSSILAAAIGRARGEGSLAAAAAANSNGGEVDEADMSPEIECAEMAAAHGVVARSSWGTLPLELRTRWAQIECDRRPIDELQAKVKARRAQRWARRRANGGSGGGGGSTRASGSSCLDMQLRHGVKVGVSWGTLPRREQQQWTRLGCDSHVNR
jgi:hypothetical protein